MLRRNFKASLPTVMAAILALTGSLSGIAAHGQPARADQAGGDSAVRVPVAKDKLIYVFHRRPDISRAEYHRKYVELHAPLGMQYTRNLIGYTVNLNSEGGPDAVTEIWVASVMDTLAGKTAISPRLPEDAARTEADHKSRGGTMTGYIVEENVLRGGPIVAEVGRTAGAKLVWLYRRGEKVPEPPAGAWRVVDNKVLANPDGRLGPDGKWREGTSDVVLIRMAWFEDADKVGTVAAGALHATEWRFRPSPWK